TSGFRASMPCVSALCERVDGASGYPVEYGADHRLQGTAGERVFHGVHDLAGIHRQFLELPVAGELRKRPVDQMEADQVGVMVLVAGGEGLLDARNADGDGSLHSMLVVLVYDGSAAPGHELGVAGDIGDEIEHLRTAVRDEDRTLYFMHRKELMDRMY